MLAFSPWLSVLCIERAVEVLEKCTSVRSKSKFRLSELKSETENISTKAADTIRRDTYLQHTHADCSYPAI